MKTEITDQTDATKTAIVQSSNAKGKVILSINGEERTVKASELKDATDIASRNP